jgi:hypothetical protein
MPDEYTPTTGDIRAGYSWDSYHDEPSEANEEVFDRWLAAHDAQVQAEALRELKLSIEWGAWPGGLPDVEGVLRLIDRRAAELLVTEESESYTPEKIRKEHDAV